MTTENTTAEIEEKIEDTLEEMEDKFEAGVEKIIDAQEKMVGAFDIATKRSLRLTEQWANAVSGTQHEFVELYKNMAKEPRAYGKNIEAWMGSMTEVQKRSLDFAKVVYEEQSEAANEVKDMFDPYFAPGKKISENAKSWMGMWMKPFQSFAA